ncbi:LysR substrate-binding domain-containing protein [Salinicola sp. JS01]|uniref:LysR substrate-binding domain-containing protein n=1 Tax=Salinicola sp. JS01 TaxID=3050071 RepID=UPI00255C2027|nr:LysR substrate-binding domain-containing protein [Salinicola sp. JS01]WIX34023.1 LysR substrate-binding domain-containing protein [Salinicola sp. JS01]
MSHDSRIHIKSWLRIKHLVLLVTLDESRSLHATARHMNMSQPAASKMLKDIENFFGMALFLRQPRQMTLTSGGRMLVRYARSILNDTDRLIDDLISLREGGHGKLVIGSVPGAAPVLLPQAIIQLKRERPQLAVNVQENSSDRLLADLEYKRLDVVLGRFTDPAQHHLFDFLPLQAEPVSIVVRAGHPLCQHTPTLAEVVRWPWVMHPTSSPMRGLFEVALAEAQVRSPRNVIETTSTQTTLQLVSASDAIALLPTSILRTAISSGRFAALPLTIGEPLGYYGVMTRKGEERAEVVDAFISLLMTRSEG